MNVTGPVMIYLLIRSANKTVSKGAIVPRVRRSTSGMNACRSDNVLVNMLVWNSKPGIVKSDQELKARSYVHVQVIDDLNQLKIDWKNRINY